LEFCPKALKLGAVSYKWEINALFCTEMAYFVKFALTVGERIDKVEPYPCHGMNDAEAGVYKTLFGGCNLCHKGRVMVHVKGGSYEISYIRG